MSKRYTVKSPTRSYHFVVDSETGIPLGPSFTFERDAVTRAALLNGENNIVEQTYRGTIVREFWVRNVTMPLSDRGLASLCQDLNAATDVVVQRSHDVVTKAWNAQVRVWSD